MKPRLLLLNVLIALGALVVPAAGQSGAIVQGRVLAAADRSALPGATVTLRAGARSAPSETVTEADGRFVFAQVPPDTYVVSVAIDGFEPQQLTLTIEPREVRALSLALDVARLNVDVQVTAESRALPATHSPSSTLLTRDRLEADSGVRPQ